MDMRKKFGLTDFGSDWQSSISCQSECLTAQFFFQERRCACPQDFDFLQIFSKWQVVELSHFFLYQLHKGNMIYMAISPYSFGATAFNILYDVYTHNGGLLVYNFLWSGGGIICVLQTHFFFKKSLLTKQLFP